MKCPTCGQLKPTDKPQRRYTGEFAFGLMPDPSDPRKPVKNFEEVATIATVVERFKAGDSFRAIARWLNGIGLKNRRGGRWHHQTVQRILRREGLL